MKAFNEPAVAGGSIKPRVERSGTLGYGVDDHKPAKPEPNDVDIFMLMEDVFDSNQVTGEASIIFDNMAAQNVEGASVFWIRRMAAIGGEEATLEHWEIKRDKMKRGIVEVVTDA